MHMHGNHCDYMAFNMATQQKHVVMHGHACLCHSKSHVPDHTMMLS